jgi:hypothetical protein
MHIQPRSFVIWQLFSGADLNMPYGDSLDPERLDWSSPEEELRLRLHNFRETSPINQFIERTRQAPDEVNGDPLIERAFLDGSTVLFSGQYYGRSKRTVRVLRQHPNVPRLAEVMTAMRAFCDAHQLDLRIVIMPPKEGVYTWLVKSQAPWSTGEAPSAFTVIVSEQARALGCRSSILNPALFEKPRSHSSKRAVCYIGVTIHT